MTGLYTACLKPYLAPEMEEVVEIVGAQISCAALGDVHVPRRGVRLGFERIKRASLRVLQRHIDPVEQLCGLVHGGTGLYSRHHVVCQGGCASLEQRRHKRPVFWIDQLFSVMPPFCSGCWVAILELAPGSPAGTR